jgi:hypothetical protein
MRYKNTNTATMYTINCRGKLLDLNTPKIMGIINCTPDSFFDGSSNLSIEHFLLQAQKMKEDGADILDIGGQSSRPGSTRIEADEEMKRVLDNGLDMLIYPEGTRNKTKNPLKSFYDGAFKLSVDTGKPIVPVVILNTKRILPAKPLLYLRPGNIILNILPAISPIGHSTESLKNLVFEIMADHYEKNNKD